MAIKKRIGVIGWYYRSIWVRAVGLDGQLKRLVVMLVSDLEISGGRKYGV